MTKQLQFKDGSIVQTGCHVRLPDFHKKYDTGINVVVSVIGMWDRAKVVTLQPNGVIMRIWEYSVEDITRANGVILQPALVDALEKASHGHYAEGTPVLYLSEEDDRQKDTPQQGIIMRETFEQYLIPGPEFGRRLLCTFKNASGKEKVVDISTLSPDLAAIAQGPRSAKRQELS